MTNFFSISLLLGLLFYVAFFVFIIWFALTIINSQKERNRILKEISDKLGSVNREG